MLSSTVEELNLIINIFDKLSSCSPNEQVRRDQITPLTARLRAVADKLTKLDAPSLPGKIGKSRPLGSISLHGACADSVDAPPQAISRKDSQSSSTFLTSAPKAGPRQSLLQAPEIRPQKASKKVSSLRAVPIPREIPPTNKLHISKDLARSLTCTLYNILEGTSSLLRASKASVFVKRGDEMISIVNVSPKLAFPPQLERFRCMGCPDAEVLGSGIALNQRINDATQSSSSVLVFPIYALKSFQQLRRTPVATIHVENKAQGTEPFDHIDEGVLFLAASLIGELMARVPQMDWVNNFYDPITQHIVAPFEPAKNIPLPSCSGKRVSISPGLPPFSTLTTDASDPAFRIDPKLIERIESFKTEILIKREVLPHEASKPPICGLAQMPTMREVDSVLENMQDCWKKNVSSNVHLMEGDRETKMEIKILRRELSKTQLQLNDALEQLRLYQLDARDYKKEYRNMRSELDTYLRNLDNNLM